MDIRKGLSVVTVLFVALSVWLVPAVWARVWTQEALYTPKVFTFHKRAVALDSAGHPHMVYGGDHLYHAYFDGSSWSSETVDASSAVGSNASLAIELKISVTQKMTGRRTKHIRASFQLR